jgi:hypothetical protein
MLQTDEGRVLSPEEVAAVQTADTLLQADNEVIRTHSDLETAEGNLHEKGLAFGRALIAFCEEYKRKGKGWLEKLPELGVSVAKAYYWIYAVEGKSNNRHKKYWDDTEFCATQNSDATAEATDGSNPTEPKPSSGRSRDGDICEVKLLLSVQQKDVFKEAAKKLVGFNGSKTPHEAVSLAHDMSG